MVLKMNLPLKITFCTFFIAVAQCVSLNSPRERRMINGAEVTNDKEWQTTVYLNFLSPKSIWGVCGGILISNQWVLTAAHPLEKFEDQPKYVTVGVGQKTRLQTPGVHNYTISKIVMHPDFVSVKKRKSFADFSIDNDIALLKLSKPVTEEMDFIDLADANEDISAEKDADCYSAGWGVKQEVKNLKQVFKNKYPASDELRKIKIKLLTKKECIKRDKIAESKGNLYGKKKDLARILCGDTSGTLKQSPCYGDNGSPLICQKDGEFKVYGILLGGNLRCTFGGTSNFMSEVSKAVGWIKDTMKTM